MDITALELKMMVLFFSILVGYIAAKTGVLTLEGNKALSKLLINIAHPKFRDQLWAAYYDRYGKED